MNTLIKFSLAFAVLAFAVDGKPQFFTNPFSGSGNSPTAFLPPGITSGFPNKIPGVPGNTTFPDFGGMIPPFSGAGGDSTTAEPDATTAAAETPAPTEAAT